MLALAGIRRLVVLIKAIENDDLIPLADQKDNHGLELELEHLSSHPDGCLDGPME